MKEVTIKPDQWGFFASTVCMIHCLATPVLFVAQSCASTCCDASPAWWGYLDFVFLLISVIAIWHTGRTTSKKWVKHAMWISWFFLLTCIMNENLEFFFWPHGLIYIPASALAVLHIYNLKFCQCHKQGCCNETTDRL